MAINNSLLNFVSIAEELYFVVAVVKQPAQAELVSLNRLVL